METVAVQRTCADMGVMLSGCPLLRILYLWWQHCCACLKPASMPFQPDLSVEKSLKDTWPIKKNLILLPIISFVLLHIVPWVGKVVASVSVRACMSMCCLQASLPCDPRWWYFFFLIFFFLITYFFIFTYLHENQQPVEQPARKPDIWSKQAAPVGKVC